MNKFCSFSISLSLNAILLPTNYSLPLAMRQLKGKVKENRKEKRERKMENKRNHDNVLKICLPVFGVIIAIIVAYVYVSTRPKG